VIQYYLATAKPDLKQLAAKMMVLLDSDLVRISDSQKKIRASRAGLTQPAVWAGLSPGWAEIPKLHKAASRPNPAWDHADAVAPSELQESTSQI
jgi:hypothetical protein